MAVKVLFCFWVVFFFFDGIGTFFFSGYTYIGKVLHGVFERFWNFLLRVSVVHEKDLVVPSFAQPFLRLCCCSFLILGAGWLEGTGLGFGGLPVDDHNGLWESSR